MNLDHLEDLKKHFSGVLIINKKIPQDLLQKYLDNNYAVLINFPQKDAEANAEIGAEIEVLPPQEYNVYDVIEDLFKNGKKTSVSNYKSWIKTIFRKIQLTPEKFCTNNIAEKQNEIKNFIDNECPPSIKSSYACLINKIFNHFQIQNHIFNDEFKKQYSSHKENVQYRKLTDEENQEIVKINFEDLKKKALSEKKEDIALYIALFSYIPPLRQIEFANMMVVENEELEGKNYVDIVNKIMVINEQKSSIHGERRFNIPDELISIINKYCSFFKTNILFEKYTSSRLSKISSRCLEIKKFNHLARIKFITDNIGNWNGEERKHYSYVMGHNVETQCVVYDKSATV